MCVEGTCREPGYAAADAAVRDSAPTDGPVGPPPDFIARFRFDELSTSTTTSDGSNPLTGDLISGALRAPGIQGNAIELDQAPASSVDVRGSPTMQLRGDLTVAGWYLLAAQPAVGECDTLFIHAATADTGPGGNTLYGLSLARPDALWYQESGNQTGNATKVLLPAASYDAGVWHHIAVVRGAITMTLTFYVDGVAIGSVLFPALPTGGELGILRIGRDLGDVGGCTRAFPGMIDLMYLYGRALDPTEIGALYRSGLDPVIARRP